MKGRHSGCQARAPERNLSACLSWLCNYLLWKQFNMAQAALGSRTLLNLLPRHRATAHEYEEAHIAFTRQQERSDLREPTIKSMLSMQCSPCPADSELSTVYCSHGHPTASSAQSSRTKPRKYLREFLISLRYVPALSHTTSPCLTNHLRPNPLPHCQRRPPVVTGTSTATIHTLSFKQLSNRNEILSSKR